MEQRELHLRDYLRVVKKRKYTVFTVFVLVVSAVVIATLSATPLYRGDVQVLIEKQEQNSLMGSSRWYSSYDPEFYETQFQLIKSLSVAKRVVAALGLEAADANLWGEEERGGSGVLRLGLDQLTELFAAAQEALGLAPIAATEEAAAEGGAESERADEIAAYVRAGVSVQPVRDSRIARISYVSPNPRLAADIANAVANAYIEEILEIQLGGARRTLDWTAKKAEEERLKLERSEQKLQKYMRDHDIVTLGDQLTVTPQKLSEISTHLTRAEARLRELQVLHEKVLELSASEAQLNTLPAIASDPALGALRAGILKAEQRQTELARKYGAKHPVMVQATEDLSVLRTKQKQEIDRKIASLQNEYEMAVANERELRGLLEETRSQASGLNEKMIQYGMLKRAAEANRQMYDALTKQLKEQSVTEDTQTVSLWIVDEARPPRLPFKPRTQRNTILGLILGLFAGIGMAFFIEYLDHSVKNPEDAEARIGLPVLGVISRVRGRGNNVETAFVGDSLAVVGEEFKSLRTAVFLSSAGGPPRSLVVTSATPGEGKTSTALNLAVAIAQSGRKVLLVDADMRRPRIHRALNLENSAGLSTWLTGSSEPEAIQAGPVPGLNVLTSGPIPPNPSELLGSERMATLLDTLSQQADVIVFDSPPLLSVSDSRILSKRTEGTIVVARAKKVDYDTVRAGLKHLRDIDARVLGLVLNGFEAKKSGYGYYQYASSYYASGEKG